MAIFFSGHLLLKPEIWLLQTFRTPSKKRHPLPLTFGNSGENYYKQACFSILFPDRNVVARDDPFDPATAISEHHVCAGRRPRRGDDRVHRRC